MKKKTDYVEKVSEITSRPYDDIEQEMTALKEVKGVTFKEFYRHQLWEKSITQQHIEARKIVKKRNRRNDYYEHVAKSLGVTKKEVKEKLNAINDKQIYKMNIMIYARYEVYRYAESELDHVLHLFAKRRDLKKLIREKLIAVDEYEMTYADLSMDLQALYDVYREIMPESMYGKLEEIISLSRPDLLEDREHLKEVLLDMAVTKFLLDFTDAEYVAFHFADKSLDEKHTFISDKERMQILKSINDLDSFDMLDDKFQAYTRLKKYYRRKVMLVSSEEDFNRFKWFCFGRDRIVVKPYCDSLGRGIKPVYLKGKTSRKEIFDQLREEYDSFIAEEIIDAHACIKALNPDSVNTVRVITYFDGEKSIVHDTFMKVGQKGSFVDNGGAGGILVSVDPETGMLNSNGCDENGVIYEIHPNTGVKFNGYQLPDWKQATRLALELSDKIPGLCYIGWDFTYTKRKKWIVVEGNAKTQFFGQQCTTGVGVRRDFIETVKYKSEEQK